MRRRLPCRLAHCWPALALASSVVTAPASLAQQALAPIVRWSGWARCDLDVSGAGYEDRQSHLWVLGGAPPASQGAMLVHEATWNVVGRGSSQRHDPRQSLASNWKTQVKAMRAPIAVVVRASDGRVLIRGWHAQLRAPGAVSVTQEITANGVAQPSTALRFDAFEWSFPTIESDSTATLISGASTPAVTGPIGPMQPAGASATALCSWEFARGAGTSSALAQGRSAAATTTAAGRTATRQAVRPASAGAPESAVTQPQSIATNATTTLVYQRPPSTPTTAAVCRVEGCPPPRPLTVEERLAQLDEWFAEQMDTIVRSLGELMRGNAKSVRGTAQTPVRGVRGIAIDASTGIEGSSSPRFVAQLSAPCSLMAADLDERFTLAMMSLGTEYALIRPLLLPEQLTMVDKREAAQLAAASVLRDKAINEALKICEQR